MTAIAVCVVALSLTACSGADGGPAESAASPAPDGWQAVAIDPITVHVPGDFEETEMQGDSEATALAAPDDGSGARAGVTVLIVDEPDRDAATELKSIYYRERATNGADDVTESRPDLDGATTASASTFTSELRIGNDTVPWEQSWLVADLDTGQQVTVGAMGPTNDYDQYQLDAVLETLDLTP